MRIKPLEQEFRLNKEFDEKKLAVFKKDIEDKLDDLKDMNKDLSDRILKDLDDLKTSRFKKDTENLEKYVSYEYLDKIISYMEEGYKKEIDRLEYKISEIDKKDN